MSDDSNKYNVGEFERGSQKPSEFKESTVGYRDILDLEKHKKHLHMNPEEKDEKPVGALPCKEENTTIK
jgi:hypothetical protein